MKIAIISFWDRQATPYLTKYENILINNHIDYQIIYWNRDGVSKLRKNNNELEICLTIREGFFGKILSFVIWRKKVIKIINHNQYDYIIVLTTYPALLLYNLLTKKFRDKYIFDIRDYSQEKYYLFKFLVMNLIKKSNFSTISSRGFMKWLMPNEKLILNHNITHSSFTTIKQNYFNGCKKINITFVGNIRLDAQTKSMLINMKNSLRYEFGFIGRMLKTCDLDEICKNNHIQNVYKNGSFEEKEKPLIYQKVDLINAVYGNDYDNLRLADSTPLPNRVYDAAIFRCPIIASRGTYLEEVILKYDLGFSINGFEQDIESQIDNYVNNFDQVKFEKGCKNFLNDVLKEEDVFKTKFINTILNWNTNA